jgi:hypothetical protein
MVVTSYIEASALEVVSGNTTPRASAAVDQLLVVVLVAPLPLDIVSLSGELRPT